MLWLYILSGVIYIIGILVYVDTETIKNVKLYKGGFLGMGYSTCGHRKVVPKDVRKGFLWPILLTLFFIKVPIWLINDSLSILLLTFNYDYKKSNLYKFINTKFN